MAFKNYNQPKRIQTTSSKPRPGGDLPDSAAAKRSYHATELRTRADFQRGQLRVWLNALADRECDTLHMYEPIRKQPAFHASRANERIARGSNRGAKTTTAAWEFAAVVRGEHPLTDIDPAYPKTNGRACVVGIDEKHMGRVIFAKLLKTGGFMKMIRDPESGKWRAFKPWQDYDKANENLAKPAPPLIPARCIKGKIAWQKRAQEVCYKFTLHNGWEVYFYAGGARPPRGDCYHLVWFDEEVPDRTWYAEMSARMIDVQGRFMWSCTPDVGGDDLIALHERAIEDVGKENPGVEEYFFGLDDNPYLKQKEKDRIKEKYKFDPEAYRVRILGEYASLGYLVYPEFTDKVHDFPRNSAVLNEGQVPKDWTRYVSVDPGRQKLGVLFCAVPPPKVGNFVLIYDEIALTQANAQRFADAMEEKTRHQDFECFLIDAHGGRLGDIGSGLEVMQQYAEELRKKGVWDRVNQRSFVPIDCGRDMGVEALRQWLLLREDNQPTLRTLEGMLPSFREEIKRWKYKKEKNKGKLSPEKKGCDLIDPGRYLAIFNPTHKPPRVHERPLTENQRIAEEWIKENRPQVKELIFGPTNSRSVA